MQEFTSFAGHDTVQPSRTAIIEALAMEVHFALLEPEVDLKTIEAGIATLIANAISADAALLDATKLSTEKLEILIREAVERNLQLRLQTGEEIDSIDVDLEMGERQ